MSIISSLFIFCLCLSSYACNARRVGVTDNGGFDRQLVSPSKVNEKVKLTIDQTKKGAENNGDSIGDDQRNHNGAMVTQKPKEWNDFEKEMKKNKYTEEAISGNEMGEASSHVGLLKAAKIEEESRWQARTVLELESDDHKEREGDTYKKNSINEDTVHVDYDPPQRNSPIHN
ncbi:hypothetical protein CsSME_00001464 [Camellia sinensis var. sinensis]